MTKNYSRALKLQVAREALLPENKSMGYVIAEKYGIMPWTVTKWRNHLMEVGEENAFKKGYSKGTRGTANG